MKVLDSKLLKRFLKQASSSLTGRWLLIGGTLLPAIGLDIRATIDIDLIGLGAKEKAQNLELMNLAEALGLSIESINQAAEFFLQKAGYTEADLIPLQTGKHCTIFRPSAALYLKLKVARLSESDLQDSIHYFQYCVKAGDDIDRASISSMLARELAKQASEERKRGLGILAALV